MDRNRLVGSSDRPDQIDGMAFFAQSTDENPTEGLIVFDNEQAHRASVARVR